MPFHTQSTTGANTLPAIVCALYSRLSSSPSLVTPAVSPVTLVRVAHPVWAAFAGSGSGAAG